MDLGLRDKTALVFGAGGGLGGAIARTLAAEGAKVAVADVNREAAAKTVDTIEASGGKAVVLEWNLEDRSIIDDRLAAIKDRFGDVDILVNNTGGPPPTPVAGQEPAEWQRFFEAMVLPVITITDRVLPAMKRAGWGRIITSTSSGVIAPIPNLGISNTLRSALLGWSKTLAQEVGHDGITSNIVLPGRVATARITYLDEQKAHRLGKTVEDVSAESTRAIPLGRYGKPEEYADVVAFLASRRASYVTGSVIRIDGGLIASI